MLLWRARNCNLISLWIQSFNLTIYFHSKCIDAVFVSPVITESFILFMLCNEVFFLPVVVI